MYLGEYKYVCGFCKNFYNEKCGNCKENNNFVPTDDPVPDDLEDDLAKLRSYYRKATENED